MYQVLGPHCYLLPTVWLLLPFMLLHVNAGNDPITIIIKVRKKDDTRPIDPELLANAIARQT